LNIVLIVADTFRADRVTMQRDGKPLMPNLAAFAAESWYFRNCRCQAAWTKPSMATLFTSLYPDVHRVLFTIEENPDTADSPRSDKLPASFETMAEYLKSHGYATAGIQSNIHVTEHFGFAQGFDSYTERKPPLFHADDITDAAIEQLGTNSRPFFLYVHYMDTHGPYDMPDDDPRRPLPPPDLTDQDRELLNNWNDGYLDGVFFQVGLKAERKFGDFSKTGEDYVRAKYDASANFLDGEIARLTARVTEQFPNTVVVVTSDHGEELFEHGSLGHGKTVYEEVSRVPLIVKVPGAAPQSIDAPVELIDVLPTCASLLGLPLKPEWQGKELGKDLANLPVDRPVFGSAQMTIAGSNRDLESVVIGVRKLIVDKKKNTELVFDLVVDQGETSGTPLSGSSADLAFARALEQHYALNAAHPLRQETPETTELTPEQQERLRTIGYLQ
jgi:arylsulfatase A-like enzyme